MILQCDACSEWKPRSAFTEANRVERRRSCRRQCRACAALSSGTILRATLSISRPSTLLALTASSVSKGSSSIWDSVSRPDSAPEPLFFDSVVVSQ
jgi:hypothetical protein